MGTYLVLTEFQELFQDTHTHTHTRTHDAGQGEMFVVFLVFLPKAGAMREADRCFPEFFKATRYLLFSF